MHAYTPRAIRQAVAAGVKCIEHGQLIDEPTAKLLADKGIWWSLQPLTYDADVFARMDPVSQKKALEVFAGTENAYKLAKKYKVKTAFGADILFDAGAASRQGAYLAKLVRWYTPAEALKMATADNGELMALSGFINPYPGKLGVVEEGALADLLLVDGNPLENIKLVADPDKNFLGHHEGWQDLQEFAERDRGIARAYRRRRREAEITESSAPASRLFRRLEMHHHVDVGDAHAGRRSGQAVNAHRSSVDIHQHAVARDMKMIVVARVGIEIAFGAADRDLAHQTCRTRSCAACCRWWPARRGVRTRAPRRAVLPP